MGKLNQTFLEIGSQIADRYIIRNELGRGISSIVYRAFDHCKQREVCVKLLVPQPSGSDLARVRLFRDVQILRKLHHPHIAQVHEILQQGPWTLVVSEYIEGEDLESRVERKGPLLGPHARRLATQIVSALSYAHRHGIVHRDIKPKNILLSENGEAILTDFSYDKSELPTRSTDSYLSPEARAGASVDARSDLYSVALSFVYALTGKPVGEKDKAPAPRRYGFHVKQSLDQIDSLFDQTLARASSSHPGDRFPTASAMLETLQGSAKNYLDSDRALSFCVLCGEKDPLEVGVCLACQNHNSGADVYLFIDRNANPIKRQEIRQLLKGAHERGAKAIDLSAVSNGVEPLACLSKEKVDCVRECFGEHEIPIEIVEKNKLWQRVPNVLKVLLLVNLLAGVGVGWIFSKGLIALAAIVFLASCYYINRTLKCCFIRKEWAPQKLPRQLQYEVIEAVLSRPNGQGKHMLIDFVSSLESFYRRADGIVLRPSADKVVHEALRAVGRISREIDQLDDVISRLLGNASNCQENALESLSECDHVRDVLVQRLLESMQYLDLYPIAKLEQDKKLLTTFSELSQTLSAHADTQLARVNTPIQKIAA